MNNDENFSDNFPVYCLDEIIKKTSRKNESIITFFPVEPFFSS